MDTRQFTVSPAKLNSMRTLSQALPRVRIRSQVPSPKHVRPMNIDGCISLQEQMSLNVGNNASSSWQQSFRQSNSETLEAFSQMRRRIMHKNKISLTPALSSKLKTISTDDKYDQRQNWQKAVFLTDINQFYKKISKQDQMTREHTLRVRLEHELKLNQQQRDKLDYCVKVVEKVMVDVDERSRGKMEMMVKVVRGKKSVGEEIGVEIDRIQGENQEYKDRMKELENEIQEVNTKLQEKILEIRKLAKSKPIFQDQNALIKQDKTPVLPKHIRELASQMPISQAKLSYLAQQLHSHSMTINPLTLGQTNLNIQESLRLFMGCQTAVILSLNDQQTCYQGYHNQHQVQVSTDQKMIQSLLLGDGLLHIQDTTHSNLTPTFKPKLQIKIQSFIVVAVPDQNSLILFINKDFDENEDINLAKTAAHMVGPVLSIHNEVVNGVESRSHHLGVIDMINDILKYPSTSYLMKSVEDHASKLFGCMRVNFLICDNQKTVLYKIVQEGKDERMQVYPCHRSIAGLVWNKGSAVLCNSVEDEFKFVQEIDDPNGTKDDVCTNLLSIPIYLKESQKADVGFYPNCIINLVNKDQGQQWDDIDINKVTEIGLIITRAADIVIKCEKYQAMRSIMARTTEVTKGIVSQMDSNCMKYAGLKKQLQTLQFQLTGSAQAAVTTYASLEQMANQYSTTSNK